MRCQSIDEARATGSVPSASADGSISQDRLTNGGASLTHPLTRVVLTPAPELVPDRPGRPGDLDNYETRI